MTILTEQLIKSESRQYDCKVIQRLRLERKGDLWFKEIRAQLRRVVVFGRFTDNNRHFLIQALGDTLCRFDS